VCVCVYVCVCVLLLLGPLLYHYADMKKEMSVNLTYEELKSTFASFGLKIVVMC